jgi:hypothetical protein
MDSIIVLPHHICLRFIIYQTVKLSFRDKVYSIGHFVAYELHIVDIISKHMHYINIYIYWRNYNLT